MNVAAQLTRWEADTSDLRRLARLVRQRPPTTPDDGDLQSHSLLARLALRGMLEEGKSEEEIAAAFGLDLERVRVLALEACADSRDIAPAADAATVDDG